MTKSEWLRCPVCSNKTRVQIREDTELKNFPLYCPKCKQESLIKEECLGILIVGFVPLIIRRLRKVARISIITLEVQNGYSNCEARR